MGPTDNLILKSGQVRQNCMYFSGRSRLFCFVLSDILASAVPPFETKRAWR